MDLRLYEYMVWVSITHLTISSLYYFIVFSLTQRFVRYLHLHKLKVMWSAHSFVWFIEKMNNWEIYTAIEKITPISIHGLEMYPLIWEISILLLSWDI